MPRGFWTSAFTLSATTIGAGIFAIPYVTSQVGYPLGFLWLVFAGLIMIILNYAYTDVVMFTSSKYPLQLSGYGKFYLGRWGGIVGSIIILVGQWGALLAYIIGIGTFLGILLSMPGYEVFFSTVTIISVTIITWRNFRSVGDIETFFLLGMIAIVGLILYATFPNISMQNLNYEFIQVSGWDIIIPYGVVFGAMAGFAVIPEVVKTARLYMLSQRQLFATIIVGTIIPLVVYLVFQFAVFGVSGDGTSEEAILGLVPYLDQGIIKLGALFGILAMLSSFLTLTYVLKDTFEYDYGINKVRSHFFALLPPVLLYFLGVRSFILALEFFGVWLGTTSMVFIFLLYYKATRKKSVTVNRHY